jgi:hypothetical protein
MELRIELYTEEGMMDRVGESECQPIFLYLDCILTVDKTLRLIDHRGRPEYLLP